MSSIQKNITLIDGGMGQELLKRSGAKPTPMWSAQVLLDQPDIVRELHADFIKAGARVITLNAYSVTPERLERDGDVADFERLQKKAIDVAVEAREQVGQNDVRIAGCLPPLVASYRPDEAPEQQIMLDTYRQIVAQQKNHVDLFMCETMSSVAEAEAALTAARESGLPTWVALSVADDDSGLLRNGQPLADAIARIDELGASAKLLNCSKPEAINASWKILASGRGPIGAYANGFTSINALEPGGTVDTLSARHDLGPENYANFAMQWIEQGANIVGGCCEVGPEHIEAIAKRLSKAGYTNCWVE